MDMVTVNNVVVNVASITGICVHVALMVTVPDSVTVTNRCFRHDCGYGYHHGYCYIYG